MVNGLCAVVVMPYRAWAPILFGADVTEARPQPRDRASAQKSATQTEALDETTVAVDIRLHQVVQQAATAADQQQQTAV